MSATLPDWPDALAAPDPAYTGALLARFWRALEPLPDLLARGELILAERLTARLRALIIEMMLATNGIAYPAGTSHLNGYLSLSQRAVLERTLAAPTQDGDAWLGRAVALVVIYRWYAPQIAARFGVEEPAALEQEVLATLAARLPGWPATIQTE